MCVTWKIKALKITTATDPAGRKSRRWLGTNFQSILFDAMFSFLLPFNNDNRLKCSVWGLNNTHTRWSNSWRCHIKAPFKSHFEMQHFWFDSLVDLEISCATPFKTRVNPRHMATMMKNRWKPVKSFCVSHIFVSSSWEKKEVVWLWKLAADSLTSLSHICKQVNALLRLFLTLTDPSKCYKNALNSLYKQWNLTVLWSLPSLAPGYGLVLSGCTCGNATNNF